MIDTNRMQLSFDHEAIERDFLIFEARRDNNGNYNYSKVPDVALQQCKALAVAYDWGNCCYILYQRTAAEKDSLKRTLEEYEGDVRVREITSRQLAEYRLAQLLCNAIPSLGVGCELYHNVTGKLYYWEPEWICRKKEQIVRFWSLQISFTRECCIKMGVKTFSNVQFKRDVWDKPQYLFDPADAVLRRALKEERCEGGERFVIASMSCRRKNTVSFLEFGSLAEYSSCKVGVLQRFLQDVQDLLTPYLSLKMTALDESVHLGTKSTDNNMIGIRQRLKQCSLYLEDTVQDEQSAELISMLRWELERYSGIVLKTGTPADHSALIRVIHSEDYFIVNGGHDVYKDAPTNCAVQHITVEDFHLSGMNQRMTKEKEDPSLRKIIQELAIKLDVHQGCIGCYDWPALGFSVPVTFVTAHKDFEDKGKPIRYVRLRVTPEGKLHFDAWEEFSSEIDLEQEKISAAFERSNGTFDCTVKGLVYEDMDNIHVIRDTDQYTLPNMEELKQKLSATRDDELLSVDAIVKAIQGGMDEFSDADRDRCQGILDAMQTYGVQARRWELKQILNLRSKLGRDLNELIGKKTGIWLSNRLKQKENRELIFGGTLDIRHFCEGNTQYYYSGYWGKSLKYSLPHACRIRKVTSMGEKLQFERYLPLLEVDFVRANGWTVIPFPFKYLREWKRLQ